MTDKFRTMEHQLIAFIFSSETSYAGLQRTTFHEKSHPAVRTFMLGSQWLYLKIYCAPFRSNQLLVDHILPLIRQASKFGVLSWFFIRFNENGPHIRLRVQVKEELLGDALVFIKKRLGAQLHYQLIQDYQADTYKRELERYGPDIIQDVERFFMKSSQLVIFFLKSVQRQTVYSYYSLAFVSVLEVLNCFYPELEDCINLTCQMSDVFLKEHQDAKSVKVALDLKFRKLSKEIRALAAFQHQFYATLKIKAKAKDFKRECLQLAAISRQFSAERKTQLLADLIHMHLNRLFTDQQRYQELIVYHCLNKYLKSVYAKGLKNNDGPKLRN